MIEWYFSQKPIVFLFCLIFHGHIICNQQYKKVAEAKWGWWNQNWMFFYLRIPKTHWLFARMSYSHGKLLVWNASIWVRWPCTLLIENGNSHLRPLTAALWVIRVRRTIAHLAPMRRHGVLWQSSAKPTKPQSRAYCLESRWAIFSDCCLWVGTQVLT